MSRFQGYPAIATITMAALTMATSYAKPDLTTPVDMSWLQADDTGYHIVSQDFHALAPTLSTTVAATSQKTQTYATPRHYRVWLAIPKKPTSQNTAKNPTKILYILDGNAAIDDLNSDMLRSLSLSKPKGRTPVLVFIGYQTPYRFDVNARAYDFTPPLLSKTGDDSAFQEVGRERLNGGAEQFYTLIETEIKPWVYAQLGNKPTQEAIWGHSYGGLFVLYNLLEHPEAYQQYFSADPSLWWHKGEMFKYWQTHQNRSTAKLTNASKLADTSKTKQIHLTFSQSPQKTATPAAPSTMMSKKDFAEEVCDSFQENCRYQFYNQSHGEVFTTSLRESLRAF